MYICICKCICICTCMYIERERAPPHPARARGALRALRVVAAPRATPLGPRVLRCEPFEDSLNPDPYALTPKKRGEDSHIFVFRPHAQPQTPDPKP